MIELNEKALEQDRARLIHILVVHFDMLRTKAEEVADLFLHDKTLSAPEEVVFCPNCGWNSAMDGPALPAPADGLEVVAWRWPEPHVEGGALYSVTNVEPPCSGWQGLVRLSDAQAALQSKDEQIERLTRGRDNERLREALRQSSQLLKELDLGRSIHNSRFPQQNIDGPLWAQVPRVCGLARSALETQEGGK